MPCLISELPGLICSPDNEGNTLYYLYDANGNVGQLVAPDGTLAARYEYDPFGRTVRKTGDMAEENPWRFSTKYWEKSGYGELGLYYYGFRFYSPDLGRWINRDPIGEIGSVNLYGFVANSPVNLYDSNGLIFSAFWNAYVKPILFPPSNLTTAQEIEAHVKWHTRQLEGALNQLEVLHR